MSPTNNFKECAEIWKREKESQIKPTTYAAYSLLIDKYLIPRFDSLEGIKVEDVELFYRDLIAKNLSAKSIKQILVVFKMILRFWEKRGKNVVNVFKFVYPKQYIIKELPVFSISQQKILNNYLLENMNSKNLGIFLSLHTGMRIGEVCALKWSDIDLKNGLIKVTKTLYRIYKPTDSGNKKSQLIFSTPKTPSSLRTIPLCQEMQDLLKKKFRNVPKDYYVISGSVKVIEPRRYREYYLYVLNSLQLPKIKFHGLRHTFATRCIESQCDYKTVSYILGHADISTTLNLYVHPTQDQKRRCIEQMLKSLDE